VCIPSILHVPHKNFLGDFNAKLKTKCIFKLTTGNESLHEISNDNKVAIERLGAIT
jgi:hypothetical protein